MSLLSNLGNRLESLVIFRGLLRDPVIRACRRMLCAESLPQREKLSACGEFSSLLLEHGVDFSAYLLEQMLSDENPVTRLAGQGKALPPLLEDALTRELGILWQLGQLSPRQAGGALGLEESACVWQCSAMDYAGIYRRRLAEIGTRGCGVFARYHEFLLSDAGELLPIANPDPVRLEQLTGYERERRLAITNTEALLAGRPASNLLLYGDSGTGKSTTVKAIANEYAARGLRLIELKKHQLHLIPQLLQRLADNPLKFILFIDDLSFTKNDENFSSLKAILEGSVSAKSDHIAIYATSNRRHLVREDFSDREGSDIHLADTLQETLSLSDRFGLTITFTRPDQNLYFEIVRDLCRQYQIPLTDEKSILTRAAAFALGRGGRSPRVARQFVENLAAQGDSFGRL